MRLNVPPYSLQRDRFSPAEWKFEESNEAQQATEEFNGILDLARGGDKRATTKLRNFLRRFPWHFDAFTHYGIFKLQEKKVLEAYAFFSTAVALGKDCFPREFNPEKHFISAGFVQNRPFLRSIYNLMDCCGVMAHWQKAEELGSELLKLDPDDRMGCRLELPKYYLHLGQFDRAAKLFESERYNDTFDAALYLYPLVLLHLGRKPQAEEALRKCLVLPQIAKYLLDPSLPIPASESQWGGLISGSEREGYYYAELYEPFWDNCPGSFELLAEVGSKNPAIQRLLPDFIWPTA